MGWINRIESNRICLVPIKGPCKELCALQSNTIISKTHKTTQLQGQGRARKNHINIHVYHIIKCPWLVYGLGHISEPHPDTAQQLGRPFSSFQMTAMIMYKNTECIRLTTTN